MIECPYISVTIHNELEKVCLCCKATVIAQRWSIQCNYKFYVGIFTTTKIDEAYVVTADRAPYNTKETIKEYYNKVMRML